MIKIYNYIKKNKTLIHSFHILPILIMLFCCVMYPIWWENGNLDNLYSKVMVFIASYGGFLGHLSWYLINRKYL